MRLRSLVAISLASVLILVVAACTTSADDDTAEATDDTAVESTDDATNDSVETDVEADDSGEAELEPADDGEVEAGDEAANEYPADEDEVAEFLSSEGFALCSDQEAMDAAETITPELDLASLEAATHDMTFVAESYDNAYVGEVTDDLLIGVSLDSRYADQADGVSVYLCDSHDVSIYLWGDIEDGSATLSDDQVEVELTISDSDITGTVTLTGGEEQTFTASAATDDAGMYVATDSAGDIDLEVRWVVADDGRQRGRIVCCWPTSHITFACGCCIQQN